MSADPADLAAVFLRETARSREPWPELFASWAKARSLTEAEARAVKVAVLRRRVFGAVARGAARAKRLPFRGRP